MNMVSKIGCALLEQTSTNWLTTQLAVAETSQYGIVRVLAACCTVKGLAIAVLVTFAIGCFYKAKENNSSGLIAIDFGATALLGAAAICGYGTVILYIVMAGNLFHALIIFKRKQAD